MSSVRQPAVAGLFYPDDPQELREMIDGFLDQAEPADFAPKAMIVPHAGYVYSGPVAASGYKRLAAGRETIRRVVLLGPAHRVPLRGLAASSAEEFATPLGTVPVDGQAIADVLKLPGVQTSDAAHDREHSLEVQLPFLQVVLDDFVLVPLAVGQATRQEVAEVLETLWGGDETLIVVSSDLSHYHDSQTASRLDRITSETIERLAYEDLTSEQACGYCCIRGLLSVARDRNLRATTVDLRNSGDTAGSHDQVVGYGAYVLA